MNERLRLYKRANVGLVCIVFFLFIRVLIMRIPLFVFDTSRLWVFEDILVFDIIHTFWQQ